MTKEEKTVKKAVKSKKSKEESTKSAKVDDLKLKKAPSKKVEATKKVKKVPEVQEVAAHDSPLETPDSAADKPLAKAGKRSAKAITETEEKIAKEERKATRVEKEAEEAEKPKQPVKPSRTRLERRGKKFREAAKLIEVNKLYNAKEAIELALKTNPAKFDATVELHIRLGVDPRQADQNIRDNVVLPAGTGKTVRIAVFSEEDVAKEALKAGADIAGYEDFLKQLDKEVIDFDILIATPNVMAKLSKYARILGPKGLMPNPKSGTVTTDINKAISQAKAGRVEYRVDSTGIVHLGIGKVSFGAAKISENVNAVFASIKNNKPASIKGTYVKSIIITTSMGPAIKIQISEL